MNNSQQFRSPMLVSEQIVTTFIDPADTPTIHTASVDRWQTIPEHIILPPFELGAPTQNYPAVQVIQPAQQNRVLATVTILLIILVCILIGVVLILALRMAGVW